MLISPDNLISLLLQFLLLGQLMLLHLLGHCQPCRYHLFQHAPESNSSSRATNLVKPSFFVPPLSSAAMMIPPVSSSIPTAPPLHPTGTVQVQRPYGTPMLQPFPPPTPPPSLAPVSSPLPNPAISREKVRDALLVLVQVSLLSSYLLMIF
jgi:hypothetical protein